MDKVLEIIIPIITLIATIYIPIRVMKFQRYTNLISDYMSFDFANSFNGIIDFFYQDCGKDVSNIPEKYYERYKMDFFRLSKGEISKEYVLHYQRRFLNDFFLELEMCRQSSYLLRRRILKDFTTGEAYVVKILLFMNNACDSNPDIYKDISNIKYEHLFRTKGINKYLENLYKILIKTQRWMIFNRNK